VLHKESQPGLTDWLSDSLIAEPRKQMLAAQATTV